LIDCGLYQGSRELAEENAGDLGFDPATVDFVLLTHAHLDHCGRLPLLTKRGFRGEIIATSATCELARLVMLDAAHLQEEEASNTHRPRHGANSKSAAPLYTVADTERCLESFKRSAQYGEPIDLAEGIRATFVDAGHILGSASVLLELTETGRTLRLLFSGDLGNGTDPLLLPPPPPPAADVVVIETTYGDRLHKPMDASTDDFYRSITDTLARDGNVIIPPNCSGAGAIRWRCPACTSPGKGRNRWRSTTCTAARSSWPGRGWPREAGCAIISDTIFRAQSAA
jgi:metallo-beta-lactamase family protein